MGFSKGLKRRPWGVRGVVILLVLACAGQTAQAMQHPLRDPSRLRRPHREAGLQVASARVLIADYELLRRDFPSLRAKSEPEIDHWLIEWSAYVTPEQAKQEAVNTR